MPFQTMFLHERLHHVRVFSSQRIQRWPCLIRRSRAEEAAPVVAAEAEGLVEAPREAGVVAVAEARAVEVPEVVVGGAPVRVAVREAAVRVAPVQVVVREAAVKAALAEAREAALAVAVLIPPLTITIRPTTSRGQSCRHSHLRLRPTNRSWRRWRKERAVSPFSTPTTCWVDSSASVESKTSSTFWGTCPATRRREAATR